MSDVVVEPINEYEILLNEEDEILIAIRARLGGVNNPQIIYDGKDKVVLYRNEGQTIYLSEIPDEVRSSLIKLHKLLMVEIHDDAIVREYMVPVKHVTKIPAPAV